MFRFLLLTSVASAVGLQTWRTLFNNLSVEVAHLQGNHIGMIQSVREIPGFLALLVVYLLLIIKEHRLSALAILILGLGVGFTGLFPTYTGLLFTTVIMSFGFHYYETTHNSLSLQYFDKKTTPWVIGKLRSYSALTNILVGAFIFLLAPLFSYQTLFVFVGSLIVLVGLWAFIQNPARQDLPVQHKHFILKKKYWLYYVLTFLAGARRQVFVAFAIFLLVKRFHFSVREITFLFMLNNAINYFLMPLIGKAIIRFGERKVLSLEYFSLLFVFLAYTTVTSRLLVAVLYILDHIFFNFSIGIRTYYQKIGDPADTAPTMAVGFTINHIAAVVIPAIGGLLWMIDYRIPFWGGAFLSVLSLTLVQFIRYPDTEINPPTPG